MSWSLLGGGMQLSVGGWSFLALLVIRASVTCWHTVNISPGQRRLWYLSVMRSCCHSGITFSVCVTAPSVRSYSFFLVLSSIMVSWMVCPFVMTLPSA